MTVFDPTRSSEGTDKDLIRRVGSQDAQALRALYDGKSSKLMGLLVRLLKSTADAEEVLQETFLEVWRRAPQYDERRGSVTGWIVIMARTRALDRLRSRSATSHQPSDVTVEPVSVPIELAEQRQDRQRINAALAALPAEQREAIELAYYDGLTQREISERTGQPLGTIKTRVRLGLRKLSDTLTQAEGAL